MNKGNSLIRLELPRIIRNNIRSFIVLVVVSSLGLALLIAMNNTSARLYISVDVFLEAYSEADITMTVDGASAPLTDALLAIDGVDRVQTRLVCDAPVKRPDGRIVTLRFLSYDDGDFPLVTTRDDASPPEGAIPIMPVEKFASNNKVKPGDSILYISGGEECPLFVAGIASTPQAMMTKRDIYVWYDNKDFGYAYIGREDLYALTGLDGVYNQIMLLTRDGSDNDLILQKALAVLGRGDVSVIDASTYANSMLCRWLKSMIDPIGVIARFLPPVFFLIMLMFMCISLSQTISKNRRSIGMLRAMGMTKREVSALYAAYTLAITIIACVVGVVVGVLFSDFVYRMFAKNIQVPMIAGGVNLSVIAFGVLVCIVTGQIASLFLVRQIAGISAVSAMRAHVDTDGKPSRLLRTRLRGVGSRTKLMLATILRKKQRFLLSALSLSAGTFLILLALSLMFSQNAILHNNFSRRLRYDAQVRFNLEIDEAMRSEIEALDEIKTCDFALVFTKHVSFGDASEVLMLCGLRDDCSLITILDESYRPLPLPAEGIVLEKGFAKDHGIRKGDTVQIDGVDVLVSGISAEDVNYIQYCAYALAAELCGTDRANTAYCALADGVSEEDFLSAMIPIEGCSSATFTAKQYESGKSTMDLIKLAMTIIIACAVCMGFVIVYNTSQYAYMDWERTYAIMRAEGFSVRQLVSVSLAEVVSQYIVSLFVSIPLGLLVASVLLEELRDHAISYPLADIPLMCAVTALIMLLFIAFGFALSVIRLKRMRMTEVIET